MADELESADEQVDETEEQQRQDSVKPDQDDDLEIDLGPIIAQPQNGGCRFTTVVLLIIVLVVAATAILYIRHVQQVREAEAAARLEREEQYKSWLGHVSADVTEAVTKAKTGQMTDALALLDRAEQKLTTIATHANDANDQQWASFAISKKQALLAAKQAITEEFERYQEAIYDVLGGLETKFSGIDMGVGIPTRPAAAPLDEDTTPSANEPAAVQPSEATESAESGPESAETATEAVPPTTSVYPGPPAELEDMPPAH